MKLTDKIEVFNADCMQVMAKYPDKYFDLAVVDPPYGIGNFTQSDRKNKYGEYKWNERPPEDDYFAELKRVSKEQIIWGANYYNIFSTGGAAIVWNKNNPHPSMSVCEIASVSWGKRVSYFSKDYYGFVGTDNNIHPCQKPVALYDWIFKNYAEQGFKILDTHGGSMSSVISADKAGLEMVCCELDKEYFDKAVDRFKKYKSQNVLEFK